MESSSPADHENAAVRVPLLPPRLANDTAHFVENPPTVPGWIRDQIPTAKEVSKYCSSLFPFLSWIGHYNAQWAFGDVVAGVTIGAVVVPQGMAYASLANLDPQYGLYSSFIGGMIYWVFGTSKDISIGPVAVLSTVVGNVVDNLGASGQKMPAHVIASALSIVAGAFVLCLGFLRFGFVVDLISITSLSAFMTGSAITIAVSQLPALIGVDGFSNRDPPYLVLFNTLSQLSEAGLDALVGLSALVLLYALKHGLAAAAERFPKLRRTIFFLNTMRTVLTIILYTFISWGLNRKRADDVMFAILGSVPSGLPPAELPVLSTSLVGQLIPHLPAVAIVMLVEHVAISKSFGRVNNYNIDPSQEMVAIGVTNILGSFFGAYPSTGSFSRTAIQSKAGVRTPFSGVVSGLIVLVTTYLLTSIFYYIPAATLAAVIVHAVSDLVTPPSTIRQFWEVSPLEVFIFFLGVVVSIFSHIENGLYATVFVSGSIMAYRLLKAQGQFLGAVKVRSVVDSPAAGGNPETRSYGSCAPRARNVFLPIDHTDGTNPVVRIESPYPGVFIYRLLEGFNYPNANSTLDFLVEHIYEHTKRSRPETFESKGDRPWNNPGPRQTAKSPEDPRLQQLPILRAIILDFSSVNYIDMTSVQRLIDVRNQLDTYSFPDPVDWHIACIHNRWTKRALGAAGFGTPSHAKDGRHHRWRSIFSVAEGGGKISAMSFVGGDALLLRGDSRLCRSCDEEASKEEEDMETGSAALPRSHELVVDAKHYRADTLIHGLDKPLFHVDLTSAVQSAILNIEGRSSSRARHPELEPL